MDLTILNTRHGTFLSSKSYTQHTHKVLITPCSRLKNNVRFVISLPDLSFLHQCGLLEMKNFLSIVNLCYELDWDRKELLHVILYHLKSKMNCIDFIQLLLCIN